MAEVPGIAQNLFHRLMKDAPAVDFRAPKGEQALVPPDSVSWRVFKNPVALFIGGIAAVFLELGEPRVRTGVWNHTNFRTDPLPRMRRTGMAAMVTVYAARSVAENMIAGVNRMHARVTGSTPGGAHYAASDTVLLDWVQATASFGFLEAYNAFVSPLSEDEKNRFYAEGTGAAALYGATGAPRSHAEQQAQFAAMLPKLEPSPIIIEFWDILKRTSILPLPLRGLENLLIRAAIEILPADVKARLRLESASLTPREKWIIKMIGKASDAIPLPGSPAVEACRRLGLPATYLYRKS
jgi:uncharacterized protein (DUF2236 family)